jgi:tight adherence protein B
MSGASTTGTGLWRRGVATAVGALLAIAPVTASAAESEPEGRITQSRSAEGSVIAVLTAQNLAPGQSIDTDSVEMTIAGKPVRVRAKPVAGSQQEKSQRAVLAIDTSNSMRGEPLAGAQDAAAAFLAAVPDGVRVGLVTFDDAAREVVPPTRNRDTLLTAIQSLQTSAQTTVYDGLLAALESVQGAPLRTVVLLTDGRDTASSATFEEAKEAATAAGTSVDTVGLGRVGPVRGDLQEISAATGGIYYAAAQATDLAARFSDSGESIANQVLVRGRHPRDLDGVFSEVVITAQAGGAPIEGRTSLTLSPEPVAQGAATVAGSPGLQPVATPTLQINGSGLLLGLAFLGVGLCVLLALAALVATRDLDSDRKILGRLQTYTVSGGRVVKESEQTAFGDNWLAVRAVDLTRRLVTGRDLETSLEQRLDAAGIPLRPAEWLILHAGLALGSSLLALIVSGGAWAVAALVGGLAVAGPWLILTVRQRRRRQAFYAQLPDTLQLMASTLTAGYSLPQAIDTVSKQADDPIASEFNRAVVEMRLGVTPEDALDTVADRMDSDDFGWVVMAVRVQRLVGGNLAEVLTTVAAVLREREYLRRQVKVLSAEGRLSAWIIGSVPIAFAIFLLVTRPEMLSIMWTDPRGLVLSALWVIMLGSGSLWLSRIVKVEV